MHPAPLTSPSTTRRSRHPSGSPFPPPLLPADPRTWPAHLERPPWPHTGSCMGNWGHLPPCTSMRYGSVPHVPLHPVPPLAWVAGVWSLCLGLRAKGNRQTDRRGEPPPNTHLQLTVLIHGQVARLQVLGAEERWPCSSSHRGRTQGRAHPGQPLPGRAMVPRPPQPPRAGITHSPDRPAMKAPSGQALPTPAHQRKLPAPPGLTLWMTPAAWMYYGDRERGGVSQLPGTSEPWASSPTPAPARPAAAPTRSHLQPLQHLVDKELDSVLAQFLVLHELSQVSPHERHHQVTEGPRWVQTAGVTPLSPWRSSGSPLLSSARSQLVRPPYPRTSGASGPHVGVSCGAAWRLGSGEHPGSQAEEGARKRRAGLVGRGGDG